MKIAIIGLGKSCPTKRPNVDVCIGVNDAPLYCDDIVCVDPPRVFKLEREMEITDHPANLYTQVEEWNQYRDCNIITLNKKRYDMSTFGTAQIIQSMTSIIPAIGVGAWLYNPKEIYLYGVDLVGHHTLSRDDNRLQIAKDLFALSKLTQIYFGAIADESPLKGVLTIKQP